MEVYCPGRGMEIALSSPPVFFNKIKATGNSMSGETAIFITVGLVPEDFDYTEPHIMDFVVRQYQHQW